MAHVDPQGFTAHPKGVYVSVTKTWGFTICRWGSATLAQRKF